MPIDWSDLAGKAGEALKIAAEIAAANEVMKKVNGWASIYSEQTLVDTIYDDIFSMSSFQLDKADEFLRTLIETSAFQKARLNQLLTVFAYFHSFKALRRYTESKI